MSKKDVFTHLLYGRQLPLLGNLAYYALKLFGIEVPRSVQIGHEVSLEHGGFGLVIHPDCVIGNHVKIYPGVTIGRADIYRSIEDSRFAGVLIEDDVILAPGAKILGKDNVLRVARGTVVGANAVLLESTEPDQIWAGVPARHVGMRKP